MLFTSQNVGGKAAVVPSLHSARVSGGMIREPLAGMGGGVAQQWISRPVLFIMDRRSKRTASEHREEDYHECQYGRGSIESPCGREC